MQISYSGASSITVFGSHEPSLRLLSEYLQRWIKVDPQDVRKVRLPGAVHPRVSAENNLDSLSQDQAPRINFWNGFVL